MSRRATCLQMREAGRATMYMLDTNTVSYFLRGHPVVTQKLVQTPMHALCISAITSGELWFGLARKPQAKKLHRAVVEFLQRVTVLPWDAEVARRYGPLRAALADGGITLGNLDMLIAAHALHANAVLVTNDAAFSRTAALQVEDWTRPH